MAPKVSEEEGNTNVMSRDTNVMVLVVTLLNEYIERVIPIDIHQKDLNQVPLSKLDKYIIPALIRLFALIGK